MKQSILQLLLKARADKRPAALLTALDGGAQSLVVDGAATGTLPLTAELETRADRSLMTHAHNESRNSSHFFPL